ncbi:MAG: sugar ABC transporter permease, partial [Spirochaetales bacterium]|nr:sugar ABC transporter permease [Spirochaetales bacterium]
GIILASMINHRVLDPVRSVVSGLFLLPWIVPQIVVAVTFSWMFQPQYGIVNFILKSLGLIDYDLAWLSTRGYAFTAVITAIIWKQLPISITMILAGLQSVPVTLIEAAKMEGASAYRLYISVILPYLKAVIATVMLITIIDNFQLFTTIWVMTSGGPLSSTSTLSIGAYREAFEFFDLGKGQAIGVIWMIILSGFVILYNRNLLKNEIH